MENLVQLCRFHHRLVHERGLTASEPTMENSCSAVLLEEKWLVPAKCHSSRSTAISSFYMKKDLDGNKLDPQACGAKWEGEKIDWPVAVGHLYQAADAEDLLREVPLLEEIGDLSRVRSTVPNLMRFVHIESLLVGTQWE